MNTSQRTGLDPDIVFTVAKTTTFRIEEPGSYKSCAAEQNDPPEGESVVIPADELQDIINTLYSTGKLDDLISEEHMRRAA